MEWEVPSSAGLTSLDFNTPVDDSLLWVYEGATTYWGVVLATRSGMWTPAEVRDLYAVRAADYDLTKGRVWRDLQDTTNDAVLIPKGRQIWADWQRTADYYDVANLMWLGIDVRLRELSGDKRSLDDFAHLFLNVASSSAPATYSFDDVVKTLNRVAPFNWQAYILSRLEDRGDPSQLLNDLDRSGYRLVYTDTPSQYERARDHAGSGIDLAYSLGLAVAADGLISRVVWASPAFDASLVPGAKILAVDNQPFSADRLRQSIVAGQKAHSIIGLEVAFGESHQKN